MKEWFKNFFTRNIFWKIVSLILGVVIWGILSNQQDPIQTKTLYIPVNYKNADVLKTQDGLVVLSAPDTVAISVSVRQSRKDDAVAELFTCTADLVDHTGGDLSSQRVHVNVSPISNLNFIQDWNYVRNDPNVIVSMDEFTTKTFDVALKPEDSLTEGLILQDSVIFSPATVTVSGPKSRFGNLFAVKATVNLKELSEGGGGIITKGVNVALYDANDRQITNNGALTLDHPTVIMSATVVRLQTTQVKLAGVSGTPKSGYRFVRSSISPDTISVQGLKSSVADLTEVFIPADAINIDGISEDEEYEVSILPYLPEGVTLASGDPMIRIKVYVEALISRTYNVPVSEIELTGMDSDRYEYEITERQFAVVVRGFQEDLDVFNASSLAPSADLSDVTPGRNRVQVTVYQSHGYQFDNADRIFITVNVTEKETEPPETEPSETGSDETGETEQGGDGPSGSDDPSESTEPTEPAETGEASGEGSE